MKCINCQNEVDPEECMCLVCAQGMALDVEKVERRQLKLYEEAVKQVALDLNSTNIMEGGGYRITEEAAGSIRRAIQAFDYGA